MEVLLAHARRHGQRDKQLRPEKLVDSGKTLGGYADHREFDAAQPNVRAERGGAGGELAHPEIVTQHRHRIAALDLVDAHVRDVEQTGGLAGGLMLFYH